MESPSEPTQPTSGRARSLRATAAVAATCIGLGAGGYALASAASGGGTTAAAPAASAPAASAQAPSAQAPQGGGPGGGHGWGQQRADETLLTGDAKAKVTAAAQAKVPGATVVRVETDADGVAKYEAHMTKADGTPVTVFVDAAFNVVSVG